MQEVQALAPHLRKLAINVQVFHIHFHKPEPSFTVTSETISLAAWHKQQSKEGFIDLKINKM